MHRGSKFNCAATAALNWGSVKDLSMIPQGFVKDYVILNISHKRERQGYDIL